MDVTFRIPDDIARGMAGDLSRRALEAFALEEYKAERITKAQLRVLLGLERMELDGFLKAHDVYEGFTLEEIERQAAALERLGV
ncbi:MAG: UPF0175 family protein [Bryobacterales bacterium]|nr:UPF0175 family protein [Bryobacterales bacterium]